MKKIPNTWANKEIELILNKEFLKWDYRKKALAKKFGINNNKAAKTNLAQVTIPEVFSSEISILSENLDLRDDAATLQAFQTYRISLYDTLDDKHMYKCGKPTFLKLYGKKKDDGIMEKV